MGRRRHQAGAGEVCVGQELGLLVEGERGLLVGRLQIGSRDPRVRVSHATPDRAAGVGAPHAAAGRLIHGDAVTLDYDAFYLAEELNPPLSRRRRRRPAPLSQKASSDWKSTSADYHRLCASGIFTSVSPRTREDIRLPVTPCLPLSGPDTHSHTLSPSASPSHTHPLSLTDLTGSRLGRRAASATTA